MKTQYDPSTQPDTNAMLDLVSYLCQQRYRQRVQFLRHSDLGPPCVSPQRDSGAHFRDGARAFAARRSAAARQRLPAGVGPLVAT